MAETGMKLSGGDARDGKRVWAVTIDGEKRYFESAEEANEAFALGSFDKPVREISAVVKSFTVGTDDPVFIKSFAIAPSSVVVSAVDVTKPDEEAHKHATQSG